MSATTKPVVLILTAGHYRGLEISTKQIQALYRMKKDCAHEPSQVPRAAGLETSPRTSEILRDLCSPRTSVGEPRPQQQPRGYPQGKVNPGKFRRPARS
eukprot:1373848-Alexandrium_andersonii.AAC.1